MIKAIERIFHIQEKKSSIGREILGGSTTFMTMAYIIFVQPVVLSSCGMDFGAVMAATCIGSALAMVLMGILTNYPIALAPAMGHNFFFAYTICLGMGISWQAALGLNFLSGIIFILFSFFAIRENMIHVIPSNLKSAIAVGIGLLITLVGLEWAGIVVPAQGTFIGLGNVTSPPVMLSLGGVAVIAILMALRIRGAILIGIIACTIAAIFMGLVKYTGIFSRPPSLMPTFLKFQIKDIWSQQMITAIFILFFLDFFDTVGTLIGVGEKAGFMKNGKLPRAKKAFLSDAFGTVGGVVLGTSTITSYIESAAGIADGARTGFANIITALWFLLALFLLPLVQMIGGSVQVGQLVLHPITAPALIMVGFFMMSIVGKIAWDDPVEAIPAFVTIVLMPVTFSITDGIAFGLILYSLLKIATGKGKELHWILYTFSILFLIRYIYIGLR